MLATTDRCSVPVRLVNLASSPRKIKKRAHIATGERLVGTEIINEDVEALQSNECYAFNQPLPPHLKDLYERSAGSVRSDEEKREMKDFLCEYADVFSRNAADIGQTSIVKHEILVNDHPPIKQRPRRMPAVKRAEAERAIQDMQSNGIIERSTSP